MLRETVFGQVAGPRAASHQERLTFDLESTAASRARTNSPHHAGCKNQSLQNVFPQNTNQIKRNAAHFLCFKQGRDTDISSFSHP